MNHSRLWKFMLLTVTLWLVFAVASPAQTACNPGPIPQVDNWTNDCQASTSNVCSISANTCSITVNQSGGVTVLSNSSANSGTSGFAPDPICIDNTSTPGPQTKYIKWVAALSTYSQAGFLVDFTGSNGGNGVSASPFTSGDLIVVGTAGGSLETIIDQNATMAPCYKYNVIYCPAGQSCATAADPRIVVKCTTGPCGGTPPLPHKQK